MAADLVGELKLHAHEVRHKHLITLGQSSLPVVDVACALAQRQATVAELIEIHRKLSHICCVLLAVAISFQLVAAMLLRCLHADA